MTISIGNPALIPTPDNFKRNTSRKIQWTKTSSNWNSINSITKYSKIALKCRQTPATKYIVVRGQQVGMHGKNIGRSIRSIQSSREVNISNMRNKRKIFNITAVLPISLRSNDAELKVEVLEWQNSWWKPIIYNYAQNVLKTQSTDTNQKAVRKQYSRL